MLAYAKRILVDLTDTLLTTDGIFAKAIIGIATFYAPVNLYAIAIVVLVLVDLVTGIWASMKKGEPFKSRIFRKGLIEKVALYGMLLTGSIMLGKVLQSVLHYETFYIAWLFTVMVSVYELSSIIENAIVIHPDLVFLNKIKDLLVKLQDKQIESIEKKVTSDKSESDKK